MDDLPDDYALILNHYGNTHYYNISPSCFQKSEERVFLIGLDGIGDLIGYLLGLSRQDEKHLPKCILIDGLLEMLGTERGNERKLELIFDLLSKLKEDLQVIISNVINSDNLEKKRVNMLMTHLEYIQLRCTEKVYINYSLNGIFTENFYIRYKKGQISVETLKADLSQTQEMIQILNQMNI
jgi:hypothetical protein